MTTPHDNDNENFETASDGTFDRWLRDGARPGNYAPDASGGDTSDPENNAPKASDGEASVGGQKKGNVLRRAQFRRLSEADARRNGTVLRWTQFRRLSEEGELETYPPDCYSFLAIHGPLAAPRFFAFGLMAFLFQVVLFGLLVASIVNPRYRAGSVDNPDVNGALFFIPANANFLAHLTQITGVLMYCMFCNSSLQDCVTAVEQFPILHRAKEGDATHRMMFSSVLRFAQGLMATSVTLLLIITTANVIEIVLNFAAVEFISNLDECAFELAKWGKYGKHLEEEAKRIEKTAVPFCIYREHKHRRFVYTVIPIGLTMLVLLGLVINAQFSDEKWATEELRVQFRDPALHPYSGCYMVNPDVKHNRRKSYSGVDGNAEKGVFGHCLDKRHWILFKNEDDGVDPCQVSDENTLVYSANTDAFDISSSFGDFWFAPSGEPLDLFFKKDGLNCASFMYDGSCDQGFNDFGHDYDGGDCCAFTCSMPNCGYGGITSAFGVTGRVGKGYPNCENPDMFPVTILLTGIRSNRDPSVLSVTDTQVETYMKEEGVDFWKQEPNPVYFTIDCDEDNGISSFVDSSMRDQYNIKKINLLSVYVDDSMEGQTETIQVQDGARCQISVTNTTNHVDIFDSEPIWFVNYTVYHGEDRKDVIVSGESGKEQSTAFHRIPQCYYDRFESLHTTGSLYDVSETIPKALAWLAEDNDKSRNSNCIDKFLTERVALVALNFAAPINVGTNRTADTLWINAQHQCSWKNIACDNGSVRSFSLNSMDLSGTISSTIGLLTGLRRLYFDNNALYGTIPSEIGKLTNMKFLDLDGNKLSGSIPTEFGNLRNLVKLDLDGNKITGTVPTEFGMMSSVLELDLKEAQLSGTIPTEIGNMLTMAVFELNENLLSGPIPTQLGQLTNLQDIELDNNMLTGTIPTEIGLMTSLSTFILNRNSLTGSIPSAIGNSLNMKTLRLTNNIMTGPLPTQLGKLTRLEKLQLGYNDFTGSIPTELGSTTSLYLIDVRGNSLEGQIPSELGLMTDLTELRLEDNDFSGTIPVELTLLKSLRILTFGGNLTVGVPGHMKTLIPCVLCNGDNYELKSSSNVFNGIPCDILLDEQLDTKKPTSANDCEHLKDTCITCTME